MYGLPSTPGPCYLVHLSTTTQCPLHSTTSSSLLLILNPDSLAASAIINTIAFCDNRKGYEPHQTLMILGSVRASSSRLERRDDPAIQSRNQNRLIFGMQAAVEFVTTLTSKFITVDCVLGSVTTVNSLNTYHRPITPPYTLA